MKVLVVGPDRSDPGGVANYYNAVFPRLSDQSIAVEYLEIGSTHVARSWLHPFMDQLRFWKVLGRLQPDIVHINPSLDMRSYLRDGLFVFQAKLRGRCVLVFFRGWQEKFEQQVYGMLKWFFSISYRRADRFIVLANRFARCLREWGITVPVDLATTTVDDELLDEFSIEEKISSLVCAEDIHLLYLARLEPEKGVLVLLDAVKTLLKNGISLTLTIAGDGPAMEAVRQRVEGMQEFHDRITIAGYVRNKAKTDLFRSHHVFCFPTKYGEGMPNSVLEAMAFGMPVVTCPVGGLADFFLDGKMGALLTENDEKTIVDAISCLVSNRQKLAEMAEFNYCYAQDRFLASITAGKLRDCYRKMCDA